MVLSSSKVPFVALCNVLEAIQQKKNHGEKLKVLKKFVEEWREKSLDHEDPDDSFHPFLRCITPQLEKISYGIKEFSLGRLYVDVMGLGKKSDAANRLMNYKKPTASSLVNKIVGDFAESAYEILRDRCSVHSKLSVQDVILRLNDMANGYLNNDKTIVRTSLEHLIRNLTGLENKWFIRMLVKDMKLGLGQDSILAVVHPDAPSLFSVDTSLERVCKTLKDINKRLHEIEVSLFAPMKPMLGKQAKPTEVEQLLKCRQFLIETKYDGERMLIHMKDGEFKYFSRNGHEYTDTYGASMHRGNLTPQIHDYLIGVKNCILDGEMCGFDTELQVLASKAKNFDIKSAAVQRYQPCYLAFDVLYLNDEVLTNMPLVKRKEKLASIIKEREGVLMLSKPLVASTNHECIDALNSAIDRFEEGIMIKHPESVYKPNARNAGWFKIKPEYVDGLMDELDVVIIGGYFGKGRRSTVLSHFLCAVMEKKGSQLFFHSMCRVGSGYSFKELLDFNIKLKEKWQKNKPSSVIVGREIPDIWIDPLKSAILQIKAAEIVKSTAGFSTDSTLRFPRVEKIREDKDPADCLTLEEFKILQAKSAGKLAIGPISKDDVENEPQIKKRRVGGGARVVAPAIATQFKGADVTDVVKESDTFNGKELCIVNGTEKYSKQQLEREVVKLGGSFVQNAGSDTYAIVAGKINLRVNNYIKTGKHNVAKAEWLINCIEQQTFLQWQPHAMLSSTAELQSLFDDQFDCYGDSFFSNTNENELKRTFQQINKTKEDDSANVSKAQIREVEEEFGCDDDYNCSLFRSCCDGAAILQLDDVSCLVQSALISARFYGGVVDNNISTLSGKITHCVCFDGCDIKPLQEINHTRSRKFHIVSPKWITDSIERQRLMNERNYAPRIQS